MCGIYGIVDTKSDSGSKRKLLDRMGKVIVHRGPDDEGQYLGKGVALGMRRLSIIDLKGGHQPIANENETVWVVCNGEIYNFREIKTDLEARGHRFRTKSDTEVIVHLYEEFGLDFFQKLRGMFGLAIWDVPRSRLILGRDRLGKKPLYMRTDSGRVLFASEIKSILQADNVPRRVHFPALREYLALGYVPAPMTLFEGIEKILPGHFVVLDKGKIHRQEYWDVSFNQIETRSEQEWIESVRSKLLESVRIRLVSDVPLGAFLSGGIDSSAIVAAMVRLTDQPVKTYSIGFEGKDTFYNELPYARTVAKAFGTDHHEIIVRPEVNTLLSKLIWHLDEPIADSAMITTYLVAKMARESVTVILSGVGGDELFGGYRRYLGDGLRQYYKQLPPFFRKKWLPAILSRLPQDRHSGWKNIIRYASAFVKAAELDPASRYMSYVTLFSPEAQTELLEKNLETEARNGNRPASESMQELFLKCQDTEALDQLLYVDTKSSLPDDLLLLTDKMTMAASLECRAPFMDHELVDLASHIPANMKVRGLTLKYLLKKVVEPWLPREIIHRKKRGFGAPIGSWIRNDLNGLIEDTLSENQVKKRGFFNWKTVKTTIMDHKLQRSDHTDHVLAMINFELWCRIFLDGNDLQTPCDF